MNITRARGASVPQEKAMTELFDKDLIIRQQQSALTNNETTINRLHQEIEQAKAAANALPCVVAALKHMLHIFDRELSEGTFGRRACDESIAALAALRGGTE